MPNISGRCTAYRDDRRLHMQHENMDNEMERRHAAAVRQQHELDRQAAERARNTAEESRVSAEIGRRAVGDEVSETTATLTTLLNRIKAVEGLRRDARKETRSGHQECSTRHSRVGLTLIPPLESMNPSFLNLFDILPRKSITACEGTAPLDERRQAIEKARKCSSAREPRPPR
jgi:hypothetical protein